MAPIEGTTVPALEPTGFLESALKKLLTQQLELAQGSLPGAEGVGAFGQRGVEKISAFEESQRGHAVLSLDYANIAGAESALGTTRSALTTILRAGAEAVRGGAPGI